MWVRKREEGAHGKLLRALKREDEIFHKNSVFIPLLYPTLL
jgi:hypothetical protein